MTKEQIEQIIIKCKKSPAFFIENFCKVKHPKAGIIPFKLFKYQKTSIRSFLKHRFNIYKKTRQSGISTLAGAFALWYAMFHNQKTVLIVSKRDLDSIAFLNKNVKFVYEQLPTFLKALYGDPPEVYNEHSIKFPNGSTIQSMTSSKDTLRSNSSSLNIIDESAFMPCMEEMWSGGFSTLMHGGSVIVISTTNGQGNWYNVTWEGAVSKQNDFNPIEVNWWDMDWNVEFKDEFNGKLRRIAPTDGLRVCETKEDKDKWGAYYSPWLEDQYRALQQKGEAHLFRQEVLADFIGTGNTVLDRNVLLQINSTVSDNYKVIGQVTYTHPVREEDLILDFENQLWVWREPVRPQGPLLRNGQVVRQALPGHAYGIGVDISTGEDKDFSAIEVIDFTAKEQVAELYIKVLPATLIMMVDFIARWYNNAFVVPERTGIGTPVCQGLYNEVGYTNVYRMRTPAGKLTKKVGFPTSATHKPQLTKTLLDYLGEDGITIYSSRLSQQLGIFIHFGNSKVGNVDGPGNHDDLVMSLAMSFIGIKEAMNSDVRSLYPERHIPTDPSTEPSFHGGLGSLASQGGLNCLMPITLGSDVFTRGSPEYELRQYAAQLGGLPSISSIPFVVKKKNILNNPSR